MIFLKFAKVTWLIPGAVCALLLVTLPVRGQAPAAPQGEIKVIVRISKQFIEDMVARKDVVAKIPYHGKVVGLHVQGAFDGLAKLSVELTTKSGEATFIVNTKGTAQTYICGVRGPIVVLGPQWGPFTCQTFVRFDGRRFTRLETTSEGETHIELDGIQTRRGGPVGRAVGRMLLPLAQLLLPRAEEQAKELGGHFLKNYVNELADEIVTKLNRTTPVEKSLNRLFPETRDWVFQLSTDSKFMQAAYGPPGSTVPSLPENPGQLQDVRIQLWLHTTATEAQDLVKLSKEPLAKILIQKYLETVVPELAALSENRSLDSLGPWLVISIGGPKAM
jgi:hypothetical protein